MAEILLTSERFVKDATSISDNLAGKFLLPAIREVQETNLRQIYGGCLLDYVKSLVATGPGGIRPIDNPANAAYKELLDNSQYFLAYSAVAEACVKASHKLSNFGVVKTTDDNVQVADATEVNHMRDYYVFKADSECRRMQRWILANADRLPQLDACACNSIRANLRSHASSGLWLGGARGKILPGGGGCC